MGTYVINGQRIDMSGQNISVVSGKVFIDNKLVPLDDAPVFNIVVEGDVEKVSGDFATVTVNGSAGKVNTMSGDVRVQGDVNGSVTTMSGGANINGSVKGSVSTMSGRITHSK